LILNLKVKDTLDLLWIEEEGRNPVSSRLRRMKENLDCGSGRKRWIGRKHCSLSLSAKEYLNRKRDLVLEKRTKETPDRIRIERAE
jgi:hypothetical protein